MPRFVFSLTTIPLSIDVLPISLGGTSSTTVAGVAKALNAIPVAEIGQLNGPIALDSNGKLPLSSLPLNTADGLVGLDGNGRYRIGQFKVNAPNGFVQLTETGQLPSQFSLSYTAVQGPSILAQREIGMYRISNYDSRRPYEIIALTGSIVIAGDVFYYTAPDIPGQTGFTVDGKTYDIAVVGTNVLAPTITGPANSTADISLNPIIAGSAFSLTQGTDAHVSSSWQLSLDSNFSTIAQANYNSANDKISWSVSDLLSLRTYYVRVRYQSQYSGESEWSATSSFTTKAANAALYESARYVAYDRTTDEYFGVAIALSKNDNVLVIGAYRKTDTVANQGAVYVYVKSGNNWVYAAKLVAFIPGIDEAFGMAVDVSADGNMIAVGAPNYSDVATHQGAVYVFRRTWGTWEQIGFLTHVDPMTNDSLGSAVAISADGMTIATAAPMKEGSYAAQGIGYIFTYDGTLWSQQSKLVHEDAAAGDQLGRCISISDNGSLVMLGAGYKSDSGLYQNGAVYVFSGSGAMWSQQSKISSPDPVGKDRFGSSVSLSFDGLTAVIGAPNKNGVSGSGQGAAYVFNYANGNWGFTVKLAALDPSQSQFGQSVSLSDDRLRIAIGAFVDSSLTPVVRHGSVYTYKLIDGVWLPDQKKTVATPQTDGLLGGQVCYSSTGRYLFASAVGDDSLAGAVYLFVNLAVPVIILS